MASDMSNYRHDQFLSHVSRPGGQQQIASGTSAPTTAPTRQQKLRSGLSGLREKANVQDRFMRKVLQHVPNDDGGDFDDETPDAKKHSSAEAYSRRPDLHLATLSLNFRHFNARVGFLFRALADVEAVYSWRSPTYTCSCLAVFSFICLNPCLIAALPIALLLYGVLVPCFVARYPAPPGETVFKENLYDPSAGYFPQGPPLDVPARPCLVKELGKESFRKMRDIQNSMGDFSYAYDYVVENIVPLLNFSNVALSSTLFSLLVLGEVLMIIGAHVVPWRLTLVVCGWALILTGHPKVSEQLRSQAGRQSEAGSNDQDALSRLNQWVREDVVPETAPETHQVEVFELQRASPLGGWEQCIFSSSPYDVLSSRRIAGKPPHGFELLTEVLPPSGWQWSDQSWTLDLMGRQWTEKRMITEVEVEKDGEYWVHDLLDHSDPKNVLDRWRRRRLVRQGRRAVSASVTY